MSLHPVRQYVPEELVTAVNVHGNDGMGDMDLIHPSLKPEKEHASDAILRLVNTYPDEITIVAIGPVTNIALAIMKEPETMKKVKKAMRLDYFE